MTKQVNFVINVPDGNHCWYVYNYKCEYLDFSRLGSYCSLGFNGLKEDENGTIKSPDCAKLETVKKENDD